MVTGAACAARVACLRGSLAGDNAIPFGSAEARVAARIYGTLRKPRGREIDIAIAATAVVRDAELWTLNEDDFRDIAELRLI
jgi:predicted nucleic acid-binding protein